MSTWNEPLIVRTDAPDVRADENAVRVLLVEDSTACAGLVCAALEASARGRFEVECADCLQTAAHTLSILDFDFDAVLVDLAVSGAGLEEIDSVCEIAHRVPVIALAGTREGALATLADDGPDAGPAADEWDDSRTRIDRADLPATILRAVRRHRRLGPCGAEPTFCRIPSD